MRFLLRDIRYGIRTLSKSPGFTALAILILGVGIGANTAVFSLVNSTMFLPAPAIQDSDSLVAVGERHAGIPLPLSYPDYFDLRQRATVFSDLISVNDYTFSVSADGEPERIQGSIVSGNFFPALGVRAVVGRTILPEDDQRPGEHPVAVIGHGFWQRRFGGDPNVAGRTLKLNGQPFTVVGVAPEDFNGPDAQKRRDIWVPAMMSGRMGPDLKDVLTSRESASTSVIGRLRPGTGIEQAQAEMSVLAGGLASAGRGGRLVEGIEVREWNRLHSSGEGLIAAFAVMAVVALILAIACANVANLLLARAGARRKEIAIRLAMGAGRARLVQQLLTESFLLSLAAGAAGLLLSLWATDLIRALILMGQPDGDALRLDLRMDVRVLGYTLAVSFITGILFGLAPALQSTKADLIPALKDGDHSAGYRRSRLRSTLAASQIAVSMVLLILAALFVKTTLNQRAGKAIADDRNVLLLSVAPGDQGYSEAAGTRFYRSFIESVRAIAGVEAAGAADAVRVSGVSGDARVLPEGDGARAGAEARRVSAQVVSSGYFKAMGFPMVQGRDFDEGDRSGAPGVVIVNETMARASWAGEGIAGKRLRTRNFEGKNGPHLQVVGVVRDANDRAAFGEPVPAIYVPVTQSYSPHMMLVVKTGSDPMALLAAIRREVSALDPDMPASDFRTMSEHVDRLLATERQISTFVLIAGALALALASVGLYGVISYAVSQRTHEIGVRMAMGARPRDVFSMVLREGVKLSLVGIGAGGVISALVTRVIESELYGVSALDPVIYGGIASLLVCVSVIASYVPARKATRVDPMVALRYE
ncbi:MAG TPA: ABC transporter permease [Blastocatellia bacterium]|nr:ABC transporter permease [Blastocatellia bacterium]